MKAIGLRQLRHQWTIYLLVLPAMALITLFAYFPAASATYHAFYRWNGDDISEPVGLDNFRQAWSDSKLWYAFRLVGVFIVANFIKMVPSVVTAVVIHRLVSSRARYVYRVAFVIPMIIPGMVWLLLWKYFYNAQVGPLNQVLNATGLMRLLQFLDTAMPAVSRAVTTVRAPTVDRAFGSAWGLIAAGVIFLSFLSGRRKLSGPWMAAAAIWLGASFGLVAWAGAAGALRPAAGQAPSWLQMLPFARGTVLAGLVVLSLLGGLRGVGGAWLWWLALLPASYWILSPGRGLETAAGQISLAEARLAAVVLAGGVAAYVLRGIRLTGPDAIKWIGGVVVAAGVLLVLTSLVWTEPTKAFDRGRPAWLAHEDLVVPAIIFWGFPWVGVVSVLLYLAGLGNIDQSVYEAADIDGCGWFRKFWNIELPLIMTQIRLNLVLMIIATLKSWGLVFILLGDTGGPKGRGMLPQLYMFRKGLADMEAGYASAIGLIVFAVIVALTVINNRYVRVSK